MATMARTHSLAISGFCLFLATALAVLGSLPRTSTGITIALVFVLGLVCLVPFGVARLRTNSEPFELIRLVCALSFVQFGIGTLYVLYDPRAAYDAGIADWLNPAMLLCIVGFSFLIYGYYLGSRLRIAGAIAPVQVRGWIWIAAMFSLGAAGQLADLRASGMSLSGQSTTGLLSLVQQFVPLSFFAFFLLLYLFFSRTAGPFHRLLLFGFVLPVELLLLPYYLGNKTFCMTLIGLPIVAYRYARGRMPSTALVASALVIVFVVFPFYNTYRTTNTSFSITTRVSQTVDRLSEKSVNDYGEDSIFEVGQRVALINSVAVVIRETGRSVDFAYGRTLGLAVIGLAIPRVIWPDKPLINLGREFSRTFRIQPRWDDKTWVAVTAVGEFYWNFGLPGVIGGMFLLGVTLRAIYSALGQGGSADPVRLAMYASLFVTILSFDGNIAAWIGSTVKLLIIYRVVYWFLKGLRLVVSAPAEAALAAPAGA